MKNVFFIVGPHGVGKTYVVSNIKKVTDVQHIDLGPLIREAHKVFAPGITFQEWIEKGEKQYGKNFTDIILCKQIERLTGGEEKGITIITGSRSLEGIKFITDRFHIDRPRIMYITAPFEQLKSNYERREKLDLTDEQFRMILQAEKDMGLGRLEEYARQHCLYLQNDNTDNFVEKIQEFIIQGKEKRGNEKMKKKLIYLTTNPHKVEEANEFFSKKYGFGIEIVNPDFEILEIQAKTCSEVAAFSAKYAADRLGCAVLKSDSGLYLDALGGLPGPYNHYFDKQIGVERFLQLLQDEKNRKARLEHCFAYCEPGKEPIVFSGGGTGTIAYEARGERGRWHDKFYIPDGETKTLSELREENYEREATFWGDAKDQFAKWYRENVLEEDLEL